MTAWTLMTAIPPTKGHEHLIQFMAGLGDAKVILVTTPQEPMAVERWVAIQNIADGCGVTPIWHNDFVFEDPKKDGFWEFWAEFMQSYGFEEGDIFVSSELYGQRLTDDLDGVFIPYDPDRELFYTKATAVRKNPVLNFSDVSHYFQSWLRTTVTIFGAESTGKTTLSKEVAGLMNGHWLFEWARPYLEAVGPEITLESMTNIWMGQAAAQSHTAFWYDKPYLIQDTDLYSTIGYWEQPHWAELGPCPEDLKVDAKTFQSDLYIITPSNIPFETDPLRYGGDHRESPDEYWIGVAEKYGLNYIVLKDSQFNARVSQAMAAIKETARIKTECIAYDRHGL